MPVITLHTLVKNDVAYATTKQFATAAISPLIYPQMVVIQPSSTYIGTHIEYGEYEGNPPHWTKNIYLVSETLTQVEALLAPPPLELAPITVTFTPSEENKILGQLAPAANTETTLYTALAQVTVDKLVVTNRGAAEGTFRVSVSANGAATTNKDYIFNTTTLSGRSTLDIDTFDMGPGDVIRVYASNANFSFGAFGREKL